jgi:hypothetical protein
MSETPYMVKSIQANEASPLGNFLAAIFSNYKYYMCWIEITIIKQGSYGARYCVRCTDLQSARSEERLDLDQGTRVLALGCKEMRGWKNLSLKVYEIGSPYKEFSCLCY